MARSAERGPTMPIGEWQAVEGRREGKKAVTEAGAARTSAAARSVTLGMEQRKRDQPSAMPRAVPGVSWGEAVISAAAREQEGGRSRYAADQAAAPKTMSGRLVQTASRSSPVAR